MTRADTQAALRNPLAFIAARWTPDPRTVRRAALVALVMAVTIVVTGGAVRLTGSGLGCPTWPKCTDDSLTATREMGLHGIIEFGNRLLTYVLCAAVGWAIIAARSTKPYRRELTRLGWAQFWVVMGNAVLGGIVVLVGLNPYTVALHFLLSTALIAVATVMWQRAREGDTPPRPLVGSVVQQLVWVLVGVTVLLIAVGTVVTGAGPHAGDSSDVPRMDVPWDDVSRLHAVLAWIVVTLTFALWFVLKAVDAPKGPLDRTRDLFLILLAQGVIGYVQYFTDLPEVLVGAHMFGSCLVWIATLRVLLSLRERPLPEDSGSGEAEESGEAGESGAAGGSGDVSQAAGESTPVPAPTPQPYEATSASMAGPR
ncbi:heme A synthase [Streptomyces sp. NPDC088789]|uniref:COX15/CtaA family protein n=1 Tax=Streptomyces sp. NPDC088789 TaxID=3365899 RepID=UPI003820E681